MHDDLVAKIRDIQDFPKAGIVFKDITPLLGDPATLRATIDLLADPYRDEGIDRVLGIEARGFIFATPVAYQLGVGFVPVRKPGKLPFELESEEYELEYGTDLLEIHRDAIVPGERVLVVDDVLATGGTAAATARLVEKVGGVVAGFAFVIELGFLDGRSKLPGFEVTSLINY